MSDLDIEIQEGLMEFAQFLFGEMQVLRGSILVASNRWFEFIEPTYRLDACTKVLTQHNLPVARLVYSKN